MDASDGAAQFDNGEVPKRGEEDAFDAHLSCKTSPLQNFDALIRNPSYSVEAWGTILFGRGGESQYYLVLAFTFTFV